MTLELDAVLARYEDACTWQANREARDAALADIPALVERVRDAEAEVARLRELLEAIRSMDPNTDGPWAVATARAALAATQEVQT